MRMRGEARGSSLCASHPVELGAGDQAKMFNRRIARPRAEAPTHNGSAPQPQGAHAHDHSHAAWGAELAVIDSTRAQPKARTVQGCCSRLRRSHQHWPYSQRPQRR